MDDKDLWRLFNKSVHSVKPLDSHSWLDADLTMPQMKILFTLNHKGGQAISSLADMLGVKVPNITFIIHNLEEKGLVSRNRSKSDRRIVIARLTDKGSRLTEKLMRTKSDLFIKALSRMSNRDKRALGRGLGALEKASNVNRKGE